VRIRHVIRLVCISACLVGCTYNEPRLRTEPVASAGIGSTLSPHGEMTSDGIKFRCVEWHSPAGVPGSYFWEIVTGWHSSMDECVYLTAEPDTILNGVAQIPEPKNPSSYPRNDRNSPFQIERKTYALLAVADYNCSNFLAGAFAVKGDSAFLATLISTILSASTTVITPVSSIPELVPTAINGGNTAITGSAVALDSNFFAKQSFDVMEAGILANRALQRAQIHARICETFRPRTEPAAKSKQAPGKTGDGSGTAETDECDLPKSEEYPGYHPVRYWTMGEALSDIIEYDRACSIEGGLKELSQQAATKQREANKAAGLGNTNKTEAGSSGGTATSGAGDGTGATDDGM
jgi:hypothetical protein